MSKNMSSFTTTRISSEYDRTPVEISIKKKFVLEDTTRYKTNAFGMNIVIKRYNQEYASGFGPIRTAGQLELESFFADRPGWPGKSTNDQRKGSKTPKGKPKQVLCSLISYILRESQKEVHPTTKASPIYLVAMEANKKDPPEKQGRLVAEVYEPFGFTFTDTDDTKISGGEMVSTVGQVLEWCDTHHKDPEYKKIYTKYRKFSQSKKKNDSSRFKRKRRRVSERKERVSRIKLENQKKR